LLLHLLFFIFPNLSVLATGQDQFVYSGFTGADLALDGVATITQNGLLELTNGTVRLKGHAFHPTPFRFGGGTSFAASYLFAIYCVQFHLCGHGMAFLVAASNNFSDAMPTQYLGLINDHNNGYATNRFFAVELDTNWSDEFNDIDNNHVGIDVNGLNSVNSSSAGYYRDDGGNFQNLTLASYQVMQAWVEYDGHSKQISVSLAPIHMSKPIKPLLSASTEPLQQLTSPSCPSYLVKAPSLDPRY
jgi:hypothetical protein